MNFINSQGHLRAQLFAAIPLLPTAVVRIVVSRDQHALPMKVVEFHVGIHSAISILYVLALVIARKFVVMVFLVPRIRCAQIRRVKEYVSS
jgi:hypothetical protein